MQALCDGGGVYEVSPTQLTRQVRVQIPQCRHPRPAPAAASTAAARRPHPATECTLIEVLVSNELHGTALGLLY